ncbi:MAG: protein kinase [Candidatus Sumerlaeia bacterium]|nr:protein kinase [Candidatus Sumerlaeia bacterium]
MAPNSRGDIILINALRGGSGNTGTRFTTVDEKAITQSVLATDLTGDGLDEVVFSVDGKFEVRSYRSGQGYLELIFSASMTGELVGNPIQIDDHTVSKRWKMIVQTTKDNLYALRVDGSAPDQWRLQQPIGFASREKANTATALLPVYDDFPRLVQGVTTRMRLIPTSDLALNKPTLGDVYSEHPSDILFTPIVFSIPGISNTLILGVTTSGDVYIHKTPIDVYAESDTPWMMPGGNPTRSAKADASFYSREIENRKAHAALIASKITELEGLVSAKSWPEAEALAGWLIRQDPLNQEYKDKLSSIRFSKNFLQIVGVTLMGILVIGALVWLIIQYWILSGLEKKGAQAIASENFAAAENAYEKLHQKRPKNNRYTATLAMVYSRKGNHQAGTLPIYEAAHALDPENKAILNSYATALLENEQFTPEANALYEKALQKDSDLRGMLLFACGCYRQLTGEMDQAMTLFQNARDAGYQTPQLDTKLCETYVATGQNSPSALALYKKLARQNENNPDFLEAYLFACIANNIRGKEVESLCYQVQQNNPGNLMAGSYLAQEFLNRGENGSAFEEAQRLLEVDPNYIPALDILVQCCIKQNQRDEKAVAIYTRMLAIKPDHAMALKAFAEAYAAQERYDGEALKIYKASQKQNPDHAPTLKALARCAKLSGDSKMAISALETLQKMQLAENEHLVQLALAYISEGQTGAEQEQLFRLALRIDAENPKILAALCKSLIKAKREDADALVVYELFHKQNPTDRTVGRQLVRSLAANQRLDEALIVAQQLRDAHPNESELDELVAFCKLNSNKLDDAVEQYEQILKRDPQNPDAQLNLAEAYAHKNRVDATAQALYERSLTYKPQNGLLLLAMGSVHLSKKDSLAAVEVYQRYLKSNPGQEDRLIKKVQLALNEYPDHTRVRWFLCEVLVSFGRLREALDNLKLVYEAAPGQGNSILGALDKVLAKDKGNFGALALKGKILTDQNETAKAMEMLEAAFKLQPTNEEIIASLISCYERMLLKRESAETRFRLGRLYYQSQKYDQAIAAFQQTAQDFRTEASSGKMLARCYLAKELFDLAFQELRKVVVDDEVKDLMYDLAKRFESRQDITNAKHVYRQLFAADINYKDVKVRFEALSNPDSSISSGFNQDLDSYERTSVMQQMSEDAKRRYELLEELGRGAMGIVYKAKDKELDEVVALKILPDQLSSNEEAVRRFKIEARNARRLSHPHIVRIHDIGEEAGRRYISMELVDGSDLKKKIKTEGRIPLETFFKYSMAIASALGYAHQLGIVHRDIKPANIMLDSSDKVKITDFGIAKLLDADAAEGTMVGAVIGTPLYMSPEQVQGIPVDNRADIYAFGIMLYEFLNTRPPFTKGDLAYQHIHEQPKRIEDCPDPVWNIISKCLQKDKEARWSNAEEIIEALREAKRQLLS